MNHAAITKAMHGRVALTITIVLAVLCTLPAYYMSTTGATPGVSGLIRGWGAPFEIAPEISFAIAIVFNAAIVGLMLHINKVYNLLRSMTRLNGVMFLICQIATPTLLYTASPGLLLALVILVCLALMFSIYGQAQPDMRPVFLVFTMLSIGASFDYAYALYIPVFLLICLQLRVFSLRCALAIVMGIATPWIILLGFGLITFSDFQIPLTKLTFPDFSTRPVALIGGTVVFTVFVTIGSWAQNVLKIISYSAQSRLMLSVITSLTLMTVIVSLIDIAHVSNYLPLLNCCAGSQVAHLFIATHNFTKSYIGVLTIALIYLMIYLCYISLLMW